MKLKISKVTQLLTALNSLSGKTRVIENHEGKASNAVTEPYPFPAQTKINIIRNISLLRSLIETYTEAQKALIKEISPTGEGAAIDNDPQLSKIFREKHDELLNTSLPVNGLLFLEWTTLEQCKVDPLTVTNLGFLVKGLPAPASEDLIPDNIEV